MDLSVEETEARIVDYLEGVARRKRIDVTMLTREAIEEGARLADGKTTEKAFSNLTNRDALAEQSAYIKIYVPRTDLGEKLQHRLARAGVIGASPFLAVLIVVGLMFAYGGWGHLPIQEDARKGTTEAAYQAGWLATLVAFAIFGIPLAMLVHWGFRELRRWRILSPNAYEALMGAAIPAVVALIGLNLLYYGGRRVYGWHLDPAMEMAILTASVSLGYGWSRFIGQPD